MKSPKGRGVSDAAPWFCWTAVRRVVLLCSCISVGCFQKETRLPRYEAVAGVGLDF